MGYCEQPGQEGLRSVKTRQGIEALDESVERDVFSIMIILYHTVGVAEDPTLIKIQYLLTRALVAVYRSLY